MRLQTLFLLLSFFLISSCLPETPIPPLDEYKEEFPDAFNITSQGFFTCARFNKKIKCWGQNDGRLGIGSSSFYEGGEQLRINRIDYVELGYNFVIDDIKSGINHTCALSVLGAVKCWGNTGITGYLGQEKVGRVGSMFGEMGNALKTIDLGTGFIVKKLFDGGSCAQSQSGAVKCWGQNNYGQLGLGDVDPRGYAVNTMGDKLPKIDLGQTFDVKKIMTSVYSSCALNQKGEMKCWGDKSRGLVGAGYSNDVGDEAGEMGNNLRTMDLGSEFTVSDFDLFYQTACAVSTAGKLKCWGKNDHGQAGQNHLNVIGDDENELRDLPTIKLGFTVKQVQVGAAHVCALSTAGSVLCWGKNQFGQLGYGDKTSRGTGVSGTPLMNDIPKVDLGSDFKAANIELGFYHSCAISSKYKVKCWGSGNSGQILHNGKGLLVGDESGEMGNNLSHMLIFKY